MPLKLTSANQVSSLNKWADSVDLRLNQHQTTLQTHNFSFTQVAAAQPLFQTNGVTNTIQNKLNLVAGTNIALTPDTNGNITVAAANSASFSGNNIIHLPLPNGGNGGLNGFTLVLRIPAAYVAATGSTGVIVTLMTGTTPGGIVIGAATIGATLPGIAPSISTFPNPVAWTTTPVPLTWPAGSFASAITRYDSNVCPIVVDALHDYYVMIYLDPSMSGNMPYFVSSGTDWANLAGIKSGNHTADADSTTVQTVSNSLNGVVSVRLA